MYEVKDSSTIAGYDWKGKGKAWATATGNLVIKFKNGGLYEYADVDGQTVKDFAEAASKGRFLTEVIKPNYEVKKLGSSTVSMNTVTSGWPFPTSKP